MIEKEIYSIKGLYRDDFRVRAFEFGSGEKSACIVGSCRGNEVQQIFTCSQIVRRMKEIEAEGRIAPGRKILVIPSMNPYSMNIQKRFWPTDNSDINRMFPGYDLGETTQRIAAGVFEEIKDYRYGIQFTSFYMPGEFVPHVRMMKTGFESTELAKKFGMPYVVLRNVRPYDTTTLNYNWQIWESSAFSLYTTTTDTLDKRSAAAAVRATERFLCSEGILEGEIRGGYLSVVVDDSDLTNVRTATAGIFDGIAEVGSVVEKGQELARVIDPYEGMITEKITAPHDGTIFFAHSDPLVYARTAVYKIAKGLA